MIPKLTSVKRILTLGDRLEVADTTPTNMTGKISIERARINSSPGRVNHRTLSVPAHGVLFRPIPIKKPTSIDAKIQIRKRFFLRKFEDFLSLEQTLILIFFI